MAPATAADVSRQVAAFVFMHQPLTAVPFAIETMVLGCHDTNRPLNIKGAQIYGRRIEGGTPDRLARTGKSQSSGDQSPAVTSTNDGHADGGELALTSKITAYKVSPPSCSLCSLKSISRTYWIAWPASWPRGGNHAMERISRGVCPQRCRIPESSHPADCPSSSFSIRRAISPLLSVLNCSKSGDVLRRGGIRGRQARVDAGHCDGDIP